MKPHNSSVNRPLHIKCLVSFSPVSSSTSSLQCVECMREIGGADGSRTHDLRIANATLSQLSYGPTRDALSKSRTYEVALSERCELYPFFRPFCAHTQGAAPRFRLQVQHLIAFFPGVLTKRVT